MTNAIFSAPQRRAALIALVCASIVGIARADEPAPVAPAGLPVVDVEMSDHQTIHGGLVGLMGDAITVRVATEDRRLPFKSLLAVALADAKPPSLGKPTALVELVDHSLLAAAEVTVKGAKVHIALVGDATLEAPTSAIRWIRFLAPGEPAEAADTQWSEMLSVKTAADLLVIRKNGALDYLEGVLQDLGPEELKFQVDKETVSVKRPKIEGLVYYHAARDPAPEPICEIALLGATRLAVRSVGLVDGQFRMTTPAGVAWSAPASMVRELDFSAGKVRFLSDLAPETNRYAPYFSPKRPISSWTEYFRPRQDCGPQSLPLRMAGTSYRKGLSLHSRSVVAYRLPGAFSRFEAIVGLDDSAGDSGAASIEILGDGKSLWRGDVQGGGQPQSVSFSVAGVKRLEIIADFGKDLDIGDFVDLCEAKVTK